MIIRDRMPADAGWIAELLVERWGGTGMAVHGEAFDMMALPALVADEGDGLAIWRMRPDGAELMSLDAVTPGRGIGTALVEALTIRLRDDGVPRLWVTTTNDNLTALRFYQRRGFRLARLRPGAVEEARRLKPSIPLVGDDGIPIRDEIELCLDLLEQ